MLCPCRLGMTEKILYGFNNEMISNKTIRFFMMMNRRFMLAIWVLFSALGACTKQAKVRSIDADIKHKLLFQPGSYWVYVDSLTGKEDSVSVQSAAVSVTYDNRDDPYEVMTVSLTIDSAENRLPHDLLFVFKQNRIHVEGTEVATLFRGIYPFPNTETDWDGPASKIHQSFLPVYELMGNRHTSVARIVLDDGRSQGLCTSYFNDSVGIIQTRLDFAGYSKYWKLKRWFVRKMN